MENKNWLVGLVVLVVLLGGGLWGLSKVDKKVTGFQAGGSVEGPADPGQMTGKEVYFDENASVMEFYQPNCSWCVKQSPILENLAKQGYRVKPMDAASNPEYWTKYNVSGTPTFLAANGDKLEGYQTEEALKAFLDAHK
jgi:protein-disulfide isomerase